SKSAPPIATPPTRAEQPHLRDAPTHAAVRKRAGKSLDAVNLDAMLANTYGRPNISANPEGRETALARPTWLQRAHRMDGSGNRQAARSQMKLGVPFGTHLRARLATNLDSRTIGEGLVEATLIRPFFRERDAVLPSKTMLYGQARTSGGRFTVQ